MEMVLRIRFEDQNITSGNMRASLGYFKDLKDEKYIVKSRAKIEYQTEFLIKPDIEYSYISDPSSNIVLIYPQTMAMV